MEKQILMNAGLTENEAEVYLLLLQEDSSLASALASDTKISRPHVYDSLNKLIEKGLASYVIKNNRKYFRSANPKELLAYLEDRKKEIERKEKQIESILPALAKLHKPKKQRPIIELYEGIDGFKTIFHDILNEGKDFLALGASGKFETVLPTFSKIFIKKREQMGIYAKLVVIEGTRPVVTKMNEYRWIPKNYPSPTTTIIYGKKVAILLWLEEPLGILIESKEVVESYKNYFELLWAIGKKK